jgi:hypothetical protein
VAESRDGTCDLCGGPIGQQRWRGFPPICSKCELETIHNTPGLSAPYIDAYDRLRDIRNMLADTFHHLEEEGEGIVEGDPAVEVISQIEDITQTFLESVVKPMEDWVEGEV